MSISRKVLGTAAALAVLLLGVTSLSASHTAGCCCGPQCPCEVCDCNGECPDCGCENGPCGEGCPGEGSTA